jgi:hypothetical protein
VLRKRGIGGSEAFRMPFFPLPALIALAGWTYIVVTSGARYIGLGIVLLVLGIAAWLIRSWRAEQWPFKAA